MIIKKRTQLTEQEGQAIRELEKLCQKDEYYRRMPLSVTFTFSETLPAFYLAYEEDKLVGALGLFTPESSEVECMAYVHPEKRNRGVFKSLAVNMVEEVEKYPTVKRALLVYEEDSEEAKAIVQKWALPLTQTEYGMMMHKLNPLPEMQRAIVVRPADDEGVEKYIDLAAKAFEADRAAVEIFAKKIIENEKQTMYCAYANGTAVGVCVVVHEETGIGIFGVAVDETERGKGYGTQMLVQVLEGAPTPCKLEVNSENPAAFHLYKKLGFTVTAQTNYAEVSLQKLRERV